MKIPKLYKYRWFNESLVSMPQTKEQVPQWQQVLYHGLISLNSPETFNDPFDCDLLLDNSFLNQKAAMELYISTISERQNLSEGEKHLLRTAKDWKAAVESVLNISMSSQFGCELMNTVNTIFKTLKQEFRVACFSSTKDSILMWSHYAQNHTGFCIEYDFDKSNLAKHLHCVRYTKVRKLIPGTFADQDNMAANHAIYEATLYKSKEWSYEKEWRCVFNENVFNLPPKKDCYLYFDVHSDISAVYLGAKASETYRAQVCDHYTGTNIKIYQMELHPDCYKLNPKRLL